MVTGPGKSTAAALPLYLLLAALSAAAAASPAAWAGELAAVLIAAATALAAWRSSPGRMRAGGREAGEGPAASRVAARTWPPRDWRHRSGPDPDPRVHRRPAAGQAASPSRASPRPHGTPAARRGAAAVLLAVRVRPVHDRPACPGEVLEEGADEIKRLLACGLPPAGICGLVLLAPARSPPGQPAPTWRAGAGCSPARYTGGT
jgi:hypothetical protein